MNVGEVISIIAIVVFVVLALGYLAKLPDLDAIEKEACEKACIELGLELWKSKPDQYKGPGAECWCKDGEAVIQVY